MDIDIELWMDATDDDDEEMEPSPYVQDVQTRGIGVVELVDPETLPSIVDDVSGQTPRGGRGIQVSKKVSNGKLIEMTTERF